MTPADRAREMRSVVTNPVFRAALDELERDAFNQFMAIPRWRRFAPGIFGAKARALIAHLDAIRDVRDRLDFLASTQQPAPRRVV